MSENIIVCAECGCVIEGDGIEICGEFYCSEECANAAGYYKCDQCGSWEHEDDLIEFEGETYCESCRDRASLAQCDQCGEWYRDWDLTEVEMGWRRSNLYVCSGCLESMLEQDEVFYCEDCDSYHSTRYTERYYVNDCYVVCEDCYSNNYHTCDNCGQVIHDNDAYWSDEDDCYYCEGCYNRLRRARSIHDYGFRPTPVFHGLSHTGRPHYGDPITIGFELEVDEGDDRKGCSDAIVNAFDEDTLYLKSDSSVDFEIVTHPHTLKAYMTELDTEKLCKLPGKYGYSSHNAGTCGLHCHVGRAQLGSDEDEQKEVIDRIVVLLYRHWDNIVKFSRRTSSQLSQWACAPDLPIAAGKTYTPKEMYDLVDNYYSRRGRYQALNLCNRGTIEFRLWRGTLCEETLLATLQLTSNIVRYCMDKDLETVAASNWTDICSFEKFEELDSYLEKRSLLSNGVVRIINVGKAEPSNKSETTEGKFAVGDKVQIIGSSGLVNILAVGATGTVIARESLPEYPTGEPCCLIRIENPDNDAAIADFIRTRCHNGSGRSPERDCYWAEADNLMLLDRPIIRGARFYCSSADRVGTVVVPDAGCGLVGMDFGPGFSGHFLDGGIETTTGWWVRDNELSVVGL